LRFPSNRERKVAENIREGQGHLGVTREERNPNAVIDKSLFANQLEYHCPPLSLALSAPPFLTLVVRTADLSLLIGPTFFPTPTLAEEEPLPKDVLFAIRIGFWGTANLCFDSGGTVLDWELDILRKEADETFCFLLKEGASLCASASASAPVLPASSESDARMGMGMFSVPLATGRVPALVGPEPPTFFFLATGCSPWAVLFALVRELARELAPPLEELVMAMLWIGGLLLELVEWVLGNSRVPRTFGTMKAGSTSGTGKGGETAEGGPIAYVTGEGNSGDRGVSISSLSDPPPVMSESPPPRVERVVDALRKLEPLGVALS